MRCKQALQFVVYYMFDARFFLNCFKCFVFANVLTFEEQIVYVLSVLNIGKHTTGQTPNPAEVEVRRCAAKAHQQEARNMMETHFCQHYQNQH